MRTVRGGLVLVLLLLLGTTLYLALRGLGFLGGGPPQVKAIGAAEQEIAFLEPATNADEWQRLVSALEHLQEHWAAVRPDEKPLLVSTEGAYPLLTAEVPEIALALADRPGEKLWIRWYKLSGEHRIADWVGKLRRRPHPPLAVLGGGSSGRAEEIAKQLTEAGWPDADRPAFLITTATAALDSEGTPLIERYAGRSFRFSFTNPHMVESVLDFVAQTPAVWMHARPAPAALAGLGVVGEPWTALGMLLGLGDFQPFTMNEFYWADDTYSIDLARIFKNEFRSRHLVWDENEEIFEATVPYSVGDFSQPNKYEQNYVEAMIKRRSPIPPHSFLVLPTGAQRMRRLLGALYRQAPLDARNFLVVSGDSISFHNIYRDRNFAWDIRDLPIPLVFFSHRNPIDENAGFSWKSDPARRLTTTGTHDLLLYRDVLEAMIAAAFDSSGLQRGPAAVVARLKESRWQPSGTDPRSQHVFAPRNDAWAAASRPLFDARGDRQRRTGEHVLWLRPKFDGRLLTSISTISIWETVPDPARTQWRLVEETDVTYH